MLTGENGLLTKVGDARIKNEEGEIKEEISLAWNSVQTDGIVNNLSLSQKATALKTELEKNGNSATVAVDCIFPKFPCFAHSYTSRLHRAVCEHNSKCCRDDHRSAYRAT